MPQPRHISKYSNLPKSQGYGGAPAAPRPTGRVVKIIGREGETVYDAKMDTQKLKSQALRRGPLGR